LFSLFNLFSLTALPGPEYGTTEAAWKGILQESERVSELHMNIKDQLCGDVMQQIRVWQKDNYHKVKSTLVWLMAVFSFLAAKTTTIVDDNA